MEEIEKKPDPKEIEKEKSRFQDEPFDFVEPKAKTAFPPLFWLQWGLLFVIGFYFISIFTGGFGNMHRYGVQESTGTNYIFLISQSEKFFFAALFLCIPAAVFFSLFLEHYISFEKLKRLSILESLPNARKIVYGLMILSGLAVALISLFVLDQAPISDDENVYLFQSRIMSKGHLTLDGKEGADALFEDNIFLVNNGKIFGQYPFGHSAMLLPGLLIGFPYFTQILAAMLTVLGIFLLGKELYGNRTGLLAALLVALSPAFLFTSGTLLSHTNTLCFLTWFGYFAVKTVKSEGIAYPILCGLSFGAAFQIRGASTMLVGMPAALVLAFFMLKKPSQNLKKILLLGSTVGLSVGFGLFLNWYVNGDPFQTNYHAAWIGKTQFDSPFGFGKGTWRIIHTPTQGLLNMINNFIRLNAWLFGWPVGFLFVFVWAVRKGRRAVDFLLLVPLVLTFTGYFFYFWPGISDTGPVLYFELLAPIALLTARGIEQAPGLLTRFMSPEKATLRVGTFVLLSILLAVATFHFYNGKALANIPSAVAEPYAEMAVPEGEKAVVFTDYYFREVGQKCWVAGRVNNHPDLGDDVIYLLDFGRDKNEEFMNKYYPDRKAYVFHYKFGIPEFMPLSEYTVQNYLRNYPDSR